MLTDRFLDFLADNRDTVAIISTAVLLAPLAAQACVLFRMFTSH